ncbi:hypothetical protein pdam_00003161 [Pocillopora damicornis]|uniref:Uncharacterized protein n=1 Tax=Pocillopora damicornis TaxID=46731 RepID=A0A3M6UAS5_POCDA|nr:hypothetical protein pdam_00003161 [Pocillopora damicornis]
MDATKKKELFQKRTEEYESMDKEAKRDLLNKRKEENQRQSHISRIMKIREGPYFICTVCNRILYKNSVMRCINNKYPCQTFFNVQQSFDGKE